VRGEHGRRIDLRVVDADNIERSAVFGSVLPGKQRDRSVTGREVHNARAVEKLRELRIPELGELTIVVRVELTDERRDAIAAPELAPLFAR